MALPPHNQRRRAARFPIQDLLTVGLTRENGKRAKGRLRSVSTNGGLLCLACALLPGDYVEIEFSIPTGRVQGLAAMLEPLGHATDGILQAFCFVALGEDDHRRLRRLAELPLTAAISHAAQSLVHA